MSEQEFVKIESFKHLMQVVRLIEEEKDPVKATSLITDLARSNLFFLNYRIIGFKDIDLRLAWEMCAEWEMPDRDKLILVPRGSFKTSLLSIGGSIFEIIRNKDIRILLSNATTDNAKAILKGIRDVFLYNEEFRMMFPKFCPNVASRHNIQSFSTTEWLRVPNQRPGIREATIEIGSVETNIVSRHYEMHIGDDIVNDKNVSTKDQIDKVESFYKAAYGLLEPKIGRCVLIGTRWHYDDAYARIMNDKNTRFRVYKRSILEPDKNGRLVSIFPGRFPMREIQAIKRRMGSYLFSSQYMNEPISKEDQVFKEKWFKTYDVLPDSIIAMMDRVAFVDPAISESKAADYTAFVVLGAYPGGIYVLETYRDKINPSQIIDKMFEIHKRWKVRKFGVESIAYQKALSFFIKRTMMARQQFLPLEEIGKDSNISKDMRIRGLQPVIQYCNFYMKENMVDLKDEMVRFPRNAHDDLLDALSNAHAMLKPVYSYAPQRESFGKNNFDAALKRVTEGRIGESKIGAHRLKRRYGLQNF